MTASLAPRPSQTPARHNRAHETHAAPARGPGQDAAAARGRAVHGYGHGQIADHHPPGPAACAQHRPRGLVLPLLPARHRGPADPGTHGQHTGRHACVWGQDLGAHSAAGNLARGGHRIHVLQPPRDPGRKTRWLPPAPWPWSTSPPTSRGIARRAQTGSRGVCEPARYRLILTGPPIAQWRARPLCPNALLVPGYPGLRQLVLVPAQPPGIRPALQGPHRVRPQHRIFSRQDSALRVPGEQGRMPGPTGKNYTKRGTAP